MAVWIPNYRFVQERGLRPLMVWLFPDVPHDHPAMGSMLMNMAASILGLGNAATPLGLRAMKDLETLNPRPGTATNAMCTYLAINTSSIQLIPATAIAVLAANNASNPTAIVGTSIMATTCAAIAAVAAAKSLQPLPISRLPPVDPPAPQAAPVLADSQTAKMGSDKPIIKEAATLQPLEWWGVAIMAVFGAFFLYLFFRLAFPEAVRQTLGSFLPALAPHESTEATNSTTFVRIVDAVSKLSI